MDKRLVVIAGIGVLSAGWLAAGTPASAGPASAATSYQTISAAHAPNPGGGKCKTSTAYPINTAILTLTPAVAQPTNGYYDLSGTYTCNGQSISDPVKGLDRHQVYLAATFTPKKRGCTRTSGTMGSYTCTIKATGSGTAHVYTQNITSNTVVLAPGV